MFGLDTERLESEFHEQGRNAFDKRCWTADIDSRLLCGCEAIGGEQALVYPSPMTDPIGWGLAGECVDNTQSGITAGHRVDFISINDIL
jgi:hypothetical protein